MNTHHDKNKNSNAAQRGGVAVYVLAAVLLAAASFALTFDFTQFERDRQQGALEKRVAALQAARKAEDVPALEAFLARRATDTFMADHMAELWAFDTTEIVDYTTSKVEIDWVKRSAKVTSNALVRSTDEVEEGVETAEPVSHQLVHTWSLVDGEWKVLPAEEPWGRALGEVLYGERRVALEQRFAEYAALRIADDQEAIYSMLRPEDRAKTSLPQYLITFGQRVLKVHALHADEFMVEADGRYAKVKYTIDCELVIANLPPEMRRNLRHTGTDTRAVSQFMMEWYFVDGVWMCKQEEKPFRDNETYAKGTPNKPAAAPLPEGTAGPTAPPPGNRPQ